MANYTLVDDLKTDILRRGGEKIDGTSDFDDRIIEYINRALLEIVSLGIAFPWLKTSGKTFNTEAQITTGTVSVTKGSTSGTFSSAPTPSVKGRKMRIDSLNTIYRITVHVAATTSFTLDGAYIDTTDAAVGYTVFEDEYSLDANLLFLMTPLRQYEWPYRVDVVDENALEDIYPLSRIISGSIMSAALIGEQRLRLSHYTEDIKRFEYDMLEIPADLAAGGTPTMPRTDRKALASGASFYLLMDKEDTKADAARLEFNAEKTAMEQRHYRQKIKSSQSFAQFLHRQDLAGGRRISGPVRTAGGLIIG